MKPPLVSVITITYNHERFIRKALDSFVMQQVNFPVEFIVADDCSTDKTQAIISQYSAKHPGMFKPILRRKNLGAVNNFIDAIKTAKGKYIAICEGDDYWIDEHKLQRQVDYLEAHPHHAVCFHKTRVIFEGGEEETIDYPFKTGNFTVARLIEENFIQTNSVMYRRANYEQLSAQPFPFDWYLHLFHASRGQIGFIKGTMSVYVRHKDGLWWIAYKDFDKVWQKYWRNFLYFQEELLKLYGDDKKIRRLIEHKIYGTLNEFVGTDSRKHTQLFRHALREFPDLTAIYVENARREIAKHSQALTTKQQESDSKDIMIAELLAKIEQADNTIRDLQSQNGELIRRLGLLEGSKTWRLRSKIVKVIKK